MRVPTLQARDLVHVVEHLLGRDKKRRSSLVAVQGTGDPGLLRTRVGEFVVVPVRSEIELRRALPPLDLEAEEAAEVRQVFLVPWDTLPLDLSGRFAGHGRVQTLPRVMLLRTRLGVEEVDPRVLASPLAEYVMGREAPMMVSGCGRLTEPLLWLTWLRVEWGAPADLNLPELMVWAATDGRGPSFVAAMRTPAAAGVRAALLEFLRQQVGVLGTTAWEAWERGQGRDVLAFGVLCEGLEATQDRGAQMLLNAAGRATLGGADARAVGEHLRGRVALAMGKLESCDERAATDVLWRAEALVRDHAVAEVKALLIDSPRLETSWNLRLEAFGEALSGLMARRDPGELRTVSERLRRLAAHERVKKADAAAVARQAEMGARLAAWLLDRSDRRVAETPSSYAPVPALAEWYTREGGYIDWARRAARPAATRPDRFGQAIAAVLREADEARRELDLRFARALVEWYAAGRPHAPVLPIERAADRFVAEFLKEHEERRLLVLLLDGMAWAQAVELLESLGERATPWAPISWMARRVGAGPFPPVLAAAPTVTQVSRAAFFAGKTMPAGQVHDTGEDPKRWAKHSGLRKVVPGAAAPRLFLGGEGHLRDGSLDPRAREQIERREERVVALVLNAIDESLKTDPQQEHLWKVESIRSLPDLLAAARASGRAVVLASDHGHVAGDLQGKSARLGEDRGGGRWRPLDGAGFDPAYEVALRSEEAWRPRGAEGVVMLADDQHSYSARRSWGDHGGATLAEVVTPLLMIGWDGMAREIQEDGAAEVYQLRPVSRPRWWHLEGPEAAPSGRGRAGRRKTPPEGVMVLPGMAEALGPTSNAGPASGAPTSGTPASVTDAAGAGGGRKPEKTSTSSPAVPRPLSAETQALARSEGFKALAGTSRYREPVLQAVDYLLSRGGRAPMTAFGDALEIPPWRVAQTVSRFAELLNADGEAVLSYDLRAQQVVLDVGRLRGVFLAGP